MAKIKQILTWLPRILGILLILFISVFALDVFGEDYNLKETAIALIMHLIPSLILILVLFISWKKPLYGGTIYLILSCAYLGLVWKRTPSIPVLFIISGPLLVLGILFIVQKLLLKKGG